MNWDNRIAFDNQLMYGYINNRTIMTARIRKKF